MLSAPSPFFPINPVNFGAQNSTVQRLFFWNAYATLQDSCTHCDCWFITFSCQADFSSRVLRGHTPSGRCGHMGDTGAISLSCWVGVGSTSLQAANGQGNAVDTACSHHQAWVISGVSQDRAGGQDKAGFPRRSLKPCSAQNAVLSFLFLSYLSFLSYSKFTKCILLRTMVGKTDK